MLLGTGEGETTGKLNRRADIVPEPVPMEELLTPIETLNPIDRTGNQWRSTRGTTNARERRGNAHGGVYNDLAAAHARNLRTDTAGAHYHDQWARNDWLARRP